MAESALVWRLERHYRSLASGALSGGILFNHTGCASAAEDLRSALDLLKAQREVLENIAGPDRFLPDQIATFLGGMANVFRLTTHAKETAETYYAALLEAGETIRKALAAGEKVG